MKARREAAEDADVQQMLALRRGDSGAFDALFARWSGPLLRYLERMMSSSALAEELVQESFLRVYRARDRYRPDARFSTWLYTIATRLALNELRRPESRAASDPASALASAMSGQPQADRVADARRDAERVDCALRALPERQRMALWLTAVEGFSYAEVAETLETSERSVKALVHRARSAVARQLRRPGERS